MEEREPWKKPRPLVRIAFFLMAHRVIFSFFCCIAGIITLLLLPVLAKNTYVSENALMPGSATPMLSGQDVSDASKMVAEIMSLNLKAKKADIEIPRILASRIANLGAEVSHHKFHPQPKMFHPMHFFSSPDIAAVQDNINCSFVGLTTAGIIRAPRGDGKEAIVLVTPYNSAKTDISEALSLGVGYSVFSLLARVSWLAKDVIWLAADSQYGEYESVAAWLKEYFSPFSGLGGGICPSNSDYYGGKEKIASKDMHGTFRRAGTMAAAIVIKAVDGEFEADDTLSIYAEASNGQMPNLDLINIVNYLAVYRHGLNVRVDKLRSLLDSACLRAVGEIFESIGKLAKSLNPEWKFGIPVVDFIEGTATLASSLYAQALGVPTGSHGAFRDYQVDAITLIISPKGSPFNNVKRSEFLQRGGRLVEGVIRSVNNLLEKFHQSFFLYLLTGPSKFVSVGVYMIAFALLVAPLPVIAASLYCDATKCDSTRGMENPSTTSMAKIVPTTSHGSWKWLPAAKAVFVVHFWSVIVSLLPYFICQIPNRTPTTSLLSWMLLSGFSLHVLYIILGSAFSHPKTSRPHEKEWAILKSMMIAAACTGLCLMSIVNFATAEIGALLLVPLCLMAQPLKLDLETRSLKAIVRVLCNLTIAFVGFPPVTFLVLKGSLEGFDGLNIGDFWNWVESLWLWSSATYLYIVLVHLPCWVLCIHILLRR